MAWLLRTAVSASGVMARSRQSLLPKAVWEATAANPPNEGMERSGSVPSWTAASAWMSTRCSSS